MAKILYTNNASAKLASAIASGDLTLTVQAGQGAEFPTITGSDHFPVTLVSSTATEIVDVTARSTDTFTIVRAQEGTTAVAFAAGDTVELRITAAALTGWEAFRDSLDTDGTLAANSASKIPAQSAVKTYVDAKAAGLSWKQAVRVATTAPLTLSSAFENGDTVDGVTLATGNRILIKDQSSGAENGIYTVNASGAPTRATDADAGAELVNATVFVSEGTANADTAWTCTNNATPTLGSTVLVFVQFGAGATYSADETTLHLSSGTFSLKDTAVTPGTYGSTTRAFVGTFDQQGRATSATDVAISGGVGAAVPPWVSDHPDTEPGTPDPADDEFGGTGYPAETSLDTGGTRFGSATAWAWRNQGGATAVLTAGVIVLTAPSGTANLRIVEQALPAGTTWKYRAKICVYAPIGNFWQAGVVVGESGSTKFEQIVSTESGLIRVDRWTSVTTYSTTPATFATIQFYQRQIYVEIERNGSNIFYRFSMTGFNNTYQLLYTSSSFWTSAPDKIGLSADSNGNGADVLLSCEWFRRLA